MVRSSSARKLWLDIGRSAARSKFKSTANAHLGRQLGQHEYVWKPGRPADQFKAHAVSFWRASQHGQWLTRA